MDFTTGDNDKGRRLDRILRKALPNHPLPLLHRLLRKKQVFINGKPAKAQDRVESGAIISIPVLDKYNSIFPTTDRNINININKQTNPPQVLFQERGLIAVNKPAGLATHGQNSLETIVSSFLLDKLSPSLSFKPGPLHRLDKPSSGIVVFSSNIDGARLFSSLMRKNKVKKIYLAIVEGHVDKEIIWKEKNNKKKEIKKSYICRENTSESKTAITSIKPIKTVLKNNKPYSFVEAEITTGRTHQIRVQAASHGHPLAGDRKYGSRDKKGFYLHAWKLEFMDIIIKAPLPQCYKEKLNELFGIYEISFKGYT
jgi:23S rRNA pseudouridine955/2504/2580 synthase